MQLDQTADEESIDLLASLGNIDRDIARRVFLKHNGDMNKAAEALLSGDQGEADAWNPRHTTPEQGYFNSGNGGGSGGGGVNLDSGTMIGPQLPGASRSVIDLTAEAEPGTAKFGPSTRAPNPDWQLVPSNVKVDSTPGISQEDQSLNDAIQASLNDFAESKEAVSFSLQNNVRDGGRPVAVRPETPSLAVAALVIQALYFVPQVRAAVGRLTVPEFERDTPRDHPARAIYNLIELFTNMDLGQLAVIVDSELLPSLEHGDGDNGTANDVTARAGSIISNVGDNIDAHLSAQRDEDEHGSSLFSFSYVHAELVTRLPRKVGRQQTGGIVRIDVKGDGAGNDLVSRLSAVLNQYDEGRSIHDVIVDPSEVIAFNLYHHPPAPGLGKGEPDLFNFPKTFHLDQFLFKNLELVNRKRSQQWELQRGINELMDYRTTLTRLNQRDTIQDLKDTIHYYETVAEAGDDPERQRLLEHTLSQLKDMLMMVQSKVEGVDKRIQEYESQLKILFDCPELQNYRYDLRAVLMHTGLPGRKQLYSYVLDIDGTWWKTCDYEVQEVSEEAVMTDSTGLHMGAGPFLLMYSKHLSDEELRQPIEWPGIFADAVDINNERLLSMVPPEIAAKAKLKPRPLPLPLGGNPSPPQYMEVTPTPASPAGPRHIHRSHSRSMDTSVD